MTATRTAPTSIDHGPVFSWFRTHGDLIYTSGHAAADVDARTLHPGDFQQETRLTLENLRRTLQAAGSDMSKVLKVTAYVTDLGDYGVFNQIYAEFFPGNSPPARTCVEVRRLPYNFKIEIEAIAHL